MPLTHTRWPLFIALVVGGIAVAAFVWATAGDRAGEAVPAAGGSYSEGVLRAPERINPLYAYANPTDADISSLIFSGLVSLAADGTPQPDLAERWEITNNGQRYVFHLRRGVAWHDGEDFDAEDVAFTYRTMADPGFNGDPSLAQLMQGVVVTARDPYTVEFLLEQTFAPFLSHLTVGILPQHLLAELDAPDLANASFNSAPVGTGPYRFGLREPDGDTRLAANSTYYLGPPHVSEIWVRVLSTRADLVAALERGDIDGALFDDTLDDAARDAFDGDSWRMDDLPSAPYYMLYLDTRAPQFNDRDVRTALFQAIDRSVLITSVGGHGVVAATGIPETSWASSGVEFPPFSPGDAATLLEREGFVRGRDGTRATSGNVRLAFDLTTIDDPRRIAIAENIASQLKHVGVTVTVVPVPADEFSQQVLPEREYEAALVLVDPGVDPDPYPFWHSSQIPAPGLNLANYRDSRIDVEIEKGRQTTDVARRKALYESFDRYFVTDMPSIPLYAPSHSYVQTARVDGFKPRLLYAAASRFDDVHEWFIETRVAR